MTTQTIVPYVNYAISINTINNDMNMLLTLLIYVCVFCFVFFGLITLFSTKIYTKTIIISGLLAIVLIVSSIFVESFSHTYTFSIGNISIKTYDSAEDYDALMKQKETVQNITLPYNVELTEEIVSDIATHVFKLSITDNAQK